MCLTSFSSLLASPQMPVTPVFASLGVNRDPNALHWSRSWYAAFLVHTKTCPAPRAHARTRCLCQVFSLTCEMWRRPFRSSPGTIWSRSEGTISLASTTQTWSVYVAT